MATHKIEFECENQKAIGEMNLSTVDPLYVYSEPLTQMTLLQNRAYLNLLAAIKQVYDTFGNIIKIDVSEL